MTPERAAALVTGWVRWYTRRLPAPIAGRRIDEIAADLHDHIAHERAHGTGEGRIVRGVLSRAARGLAADAAWRDRHRPWRADFMNSLTTRLAAAFALVAVGVAAMLYGADDDAPGLVLIGLLMVAGGVLLAGRALYRRRRGAGG